MTHQVLGAPSCKAAKNMKVSKLGIETAGNDTPFYNQIILTFHLIKYSTMGLFCSSIRTLMPSISSTSATSP